ncbi:MAG TPA: ATP-binding protein [Sphingobium sp.]|uniref:ATP-binding protein n=1 Tax=unclassified Sphingobium TaxID=2611147 RepID=UPI0007F535E0|nr:MULTISPECIES: ATP-binding protein [unclassified Sphingobium]OAN57769.1 ATPase [Sphingobium sp. TCM1]WIW87575.1 ATP-binding protein [Sphingobium sp. V4]HAF41918.1 ATP-binding protein [Sphingobium sp.]
MTAIDQGILQERTGLLGRFLSSALGDTRRRSDRLIPDEVQLEADMRAVPGFHHASSEQETDDAQPRPLSMSAMTAPIRPISLRRDSIYAAFNTAMPVTDRHGLAGRNSELEKLVEAIVVQRKHAVVFGTRGSGKTSLARVFGDLADEAGCVALYASANGDSDFDALFRPFLPELPMSAAGRERLKTMLADRLDVARLAALLVEEVRERSILIIDEYDRVESDGAKQDVAALLKLLTDIHSPVQVVLVGIASDIDGLIAAHPSLRRHLVPQRVSPIPRPQLERLLASCASNARLTIDPDALEALAAAAMGSPYHARLFGMHAALACEGAGRDHVTLADAEQGLADALTGWAEMSEPTHALFRRILWEAGASRRMIGLAAVVAAQMLAISSDRLARLGHEVLGGGSINEGQARDAMARLQPALVTTPNGELWMFEDTLAPQFLLLMAKQQVTAAPPEQSPAEEMRALLRGVDGL